MNEKEQQEFADLLEEFNEWVESFTHRKDAGPLEFVSEFVTLLRKLVGNLDDRLINIERKLP